ncbi:alpha-glucosidase [Bifidobacterium hapali]|uniref:Alpha-glucosidase n=1 Tax=Bifidobacterium hapali TaxID=1630172 RepID=A0A261G125_9BIFI|nr:alpha-glucosidase [Bifidobacterium hapali]
MLTTLIRNTDPDGPVTRGTVRCSPTRPRSFADCTSAPEDHAQRASTAYEVPDEYRFGTELIVSPIVAPNDRAVQRGRTNVWLPQGDWFDLFSGRHYESRPTGGRRMEVWRPIDRIPVFAKAGGIVPLQPVAERRESINDIANPSALSLLVFPGASGEFTLREDNGRFGSRSMDTSIEFAWKPDGMSCLTILGVS